MNPKVTLEVTKGQLTGEKYEFEDRDPCIVGRQKECGIKLADVIDQALDDSGKLNFKTAAEFKKPLQKAL